MSARWAVHEGDVRVPDVLLALDEASFDAVLCDPPYELGFMGKRWDASGVAFDPAMWGRVLRALRPGAPLLAFGGTRTYHRMVCAIEDAGFEIRDCLSWMYGSGFPKSLDVSKAIDAAAGAERPVIGEQTLTGNAAVSTKDKGGTFGVQVGTVPAKTIAITGPATPLAQAWDGYGTSLKPAWEPCVLARKPLDGTIVANVTKHGVGGLAIDACRIGTSKDVPASPPKDRRSQLAKGAERGRTSDTSGFDPTVGRWPANLVLDEAAAKALDEQSGDRPGMSGGGNHSDGYEGGMFGAIDCSHTARGDNGGASRFFYTSKVSTSERNDGLDDLPELSGGEATGRVDGSVGAQSPRAGSGRGGTARNPHPTMKPIALTKYLAKLILPPRGIGRPRRLLVPFCGVASEMVGALRAGWDEVVGIELSEEYARIARLRLSRVDVSHQPELFGT